MLFGTLDYIAPLTGDIVGRKVSHYEFIKALITYSNFKEYHFFTGDLVTATQSHDALKEIAEDTENAKRVKILRRDQIPRYVKSRNYTVFHRHDPQIESLCYMRERFSSYPFPITGIIHSISYQRLQHDFFSLIAANTYPFDSILCTSTAAQAVMTKLFDSLSKNATKKFDSHLQYNGRFDLLPFGVDTDRFKPAKNNDEKIFLRKKNGLPEDGLLVLTVSRFSNYSKMDLYPILRKMKTIMSKHKQLTYIMAGSGYESDYPEKLKEFSQRLGINGSIVIMKDIDEAVKADLYRSADIFLSPSDNHQESFGLTILEAMSSGLPVVASDWNGYKDIVDNGKTGLLVHTFWGECDETITDLAPISFEREYHLHLAQSVAVDVNHLSSQLDKIIIDKEMKKKMGDNARKRVEHNFSWKNIIERYETLVMDLKKKADTQERKEKGENDYLFLMNYFDAFNHYPSKIVNDEDRVILSEYGIGIATKKEKITMYEDMENILPMDIVLLILQHVFQKEMTVSEIKQLFANSHHTPHTITYSILWMMKVDFLQIVPSVSNH